VNVARTVSGHSQSGPAVKIAPSRARRATSGMPALSITRTSPAGIGSEIACAGRKQQSGVAARAGATGTSSSAQAPSAAGRVRRSIAAVNGPPGAELRRAAGGGPRYAAAGAAGSAGAGASASAFANVSSPSAASTLTVSPSRKRPSRIPSASASTRRFWITRLSGRAP